MIKRYGFNEAGMREILNDSVEPKTMYIREKDHLEAMAKLEARCKELESALNNFDDLAMVTDKTYAIYHAKLKAKTKNLLATPTTTKHLANWYQGMLGEPVAWTSPCRSVLYLATKDTVFGSHTIPLYAPKKVSE